MQQTRLYQKHLAQGARMVPFGGWEMPVQYAGILKEHEHTRRAASVFDISHMGEFELSGSGAAADLEKLLTLHVTTLNPGQCRYGFMLNEAGGVLDDLTCYRLGEEQFYLVVNAATCGKDAAWIQERLSSKTGFKDASAQTAKLDVQGPASRTALEALTGADLSGLNYFRAQPMTLFGIPMLVSRTGYTGELGYELYFPVEAAESVWSRLLEHPQLEPAGLGARDTLRLEMGYSLYGHELDEQHSPVPVSRGMFIKKTGGFIGAQPVLKELEQGSAFYQQPLRLEGRRAARTGDVVYAGDRPVGTVTSGSLAPSLGSAVALARIDAGAEAEALTVEVRGKRLICERAELPFYRHGTARN
jgi:aminomethyltransferase